jgi:hypothetical protein
MKLLTHMRRACALLSLAVALHLVASAHEGEEHGNHDPKFNGLVMMYVDLHFEIVLGEKGGVRIYYSDAARAELPAAVVSDVKVDLLRKAAEPETVAMSVSDAGDYWEGRGHVVEDRETIVRIAFVFQEEPLVFELPAWMFPAFREAAVHTAEA